MVIREIRSDNQKTDLYWNKYVYVVLHDKQRDNRWRIKIKRQLCIIRSRRGYYDGVHNESSPKTITEGNVKGHIERG